MAAYDCTIPSASAAARGTGLSLPACGGSINAVTPVLLPTQLDGCEVASRSMTAGRRMLSPRGYRYRQCPAFHARAEPAACWQPQDH